MKKRTAMAVAVLTLSTVGFVATPSQAATVKNGVNCTKANATTKVGTKTYRCAKNPYVKPTRLTWTLANCLTAYRLWKEANSEYSNWESLAKLAGAEGQKTLDELQASINSLEATMKEKACKQGV